ncbi:hypothetical protein ACWEIJ_21710 [Lentzea sp. NPDC004789]
MTFERWLDEADRVLVASGVADAAGVAGVVKVAVWRVWRGGVAEVARSRCGGCGAWRAADVAGTADVAGVACGWCRWAPRCPSLPLDLLGPVGVRAEHGVDHDVARPAPIQAFPFDELTTHPPFERITAPIEAAEVQRE